MIKNNSREPLQCTEKFTGKLVVITGATSGIGRVTALKYASMGADILCINRNIDKSNTLKQEIEDKYNVECHYIIADLSHLEDIHRCAKELLAIERDINVLIHNAGVYLTKKEINSDGIEKVFTVHYLSSFIINYILMSKLQRQDSARIILVNSEGHRFAAWGLNLDDINWERKRYAGFKSYGNAKLAQLLSMLVFDKYLSDGHVTINAMHPGAVKSESGGENGALYQWYKRNILERNLKPADISAEALYYLGVSMEVEDIRAKFFNLTTLEDPAPPALDMEVAEKLWKKSVELSKV